ncbi:uncharacterized protein LOC130808548 [Amaranthus tricolor]|uniref:uncharacterized protein LOC130808548 n=1 Tax=Amaranthus tricolor TaxID=29722 RepID=UPI002584F524|nr:uncharacterized protein LOC130808548 [Amaranthus tricolor]
MACITSTSYVIMLNGIPTPIFHAKRSSSRRPAFPSAFCYWLGILVVYPEKRRRSLCNFLHLFSQAYGLQANSAKSAIHTTGVLSDIKAELRDLSRFTYGSFLLSILGFLYLPNVLAWLTLINSVLMGISTYWCQMFILPCLVIHLVNSICRSFLWLGTHDSHKPGHVNWDTICKPKKAAVGIAWHISHLRESLWVKWVHGVYTKGGRWEIFNAPITASWTLKKICWLGQHYLEHAFNSKDSFYLLDRRSSKAKTLDELFHIGVLYNDLCPLCGIRSESNTHLFFECTFSQ